MPDRTSYSHDGLTYDSETDTYRAVYTNSTGPPSLALVEAICEIEDVEPADLDPLHAVFDPESLDNLLQWEKDGDRAVEFSYHGFDVLANSYGVIELTPRNGGRPADD